MGRVKRSRSGFIKALSNPSTKAATNADEKLDIKTPGKM